MSNWRDPDDEDYKLPSRREIRIFNEANKPNPKLPLRLFVTIVILIIILTFGAIQFVSPQHSLELKNPISIALESSLKDRDYRSADVLTRTLLYDLAETTERYIGPRDIEEIGCDDIKHIDNLWKRYSSGRFGFSVQIAIWTEIENKRNLTSSRAIEFGKQVGWYKEDKKGWIEIDEMNYTLNAPLGHLPTRSPVFGTITLQDTSKNYPTELDKGWLFDSFRQSAIGSQCLN